MNHSGTDDIQLREAQKEIQESRALLSAIVDGNDEPNRSSMPRPAMPPWSFTVNRVPVARAIHHMSDRCNRRLVPVHCGAIPENLIESEFFGYKKGAFSGAAADKSGYLDFADGGTLLLDEVGEISLHMQVKLLRVIEGYGYTPVGSSQVKQSDARIIAATNRNLKERITQHKIREDFFYRIHILPINSPSTSWALHPRGLLPKSRRRPWRLTIPRSET